MSAAGGPELKQDPFELPDDVTVAKSVRSASRMVEAAPGYVVDVGGSVPVWVETKKPADPVDIITLMANMREQGATIDVLLQERDQLKARVDQLEEIVKRLDLVIGSTTQVNYGQRVEPKNVPSDRYEESKMRLRKLSGT
jgi:hypothetical protein